MADSDISHGRGGGGGLSGALGPEQNEFGDATTADKAAAEALRDAYALANAAWLAQYDGNLGFFILLHWTGGNQQLQSRNLAGTAWEDATGVVAGPRGTQGTPGPAYAPGAGSLARDLLAPDAGFPNYIAFISYDGSSNTLSGSVLGVSDLRWPAVVFFVIPTIDRQAIPLELRIGGHNEALQTLAGEAVTARDLTANLLAEVLVLNGPYRLVEPLPPRSQDFAIHLFLFEVPNDPADIYADVTHTLTQALLDGSTAANSARSALTSPDVPWPNYQYQQAFADAPPADDPYSRFLNLFWYIGVPDDAPNIRAYGTGDSQSGPGSLNTGVERIPGALNIGGVPHKFVRLLSQPSPDFTNDPPADWNAFLYDTGLFSRIAFEGLPDPSLA